jgi:hypothetical protein
MLHYISYALPIMTQIIIAIQDMQLKDWLTILMIHLKD